MVRTRRTNECDWNGADRIGRFSPGGPGHSTSKCLDYCKKDRLCRYSARSPSGYCHNFRTCKGRDRPGDWVVYEKKATDTSGTGDPNARYNYETKEGSCQTRTGGKGNYRSYQDSPNQMAPCQKRCNSDSNCVAFEYNMATGSCEIHSNGVTTSSGRCKKETTACWKIGKGCSGNVGEYAVCDMQCRFKGERVKEIPPFHCPKKTYTGQCANDLRAFHIMGETNPKEILRIRCERVVVVCGLIH